MVCVLDLKAGPCGFAVAWGGVDPVEQDPSLDPVTRVDDIEPVGRVLRLDRGAGRSVGHRLETLRHMSVRVEPFDCLAGAQDKLPAFAGSRDTHRRSATPRGISTSLDANGDNISDNSRHLLDGFFAGFFAAGFFAAAFFGFALAFASGAAASGTGSFATDSAALSSACPSVRRNMLDRKRTRLNSSH